MIGARLALAGVGVLYLAAAPPAQSAAAVASRFSSAPAVDPGAPNWNGVWTKVGSLNFDPTISGGRVDNPPLTPEYQAIYQRGLDSMKAGRPANDPTAACIPPGFPRMMNMPYPMEIFQRPGQVAIFAEYQEQLRRIYTDGRKYDPDSDPSYNGFSVGRWENGDLIVETRGLRDDTYLTQYGLKLSGELVVHERWRQVDENTLTDTFTLVDPKALTRPWTVTKTFKRAPGVQIMQYVCLENNRNPLNSDGTTGVVLNKSLAQ